MPYGSTSLAVAQALVGSVSAYLAFELRICGYDLYASPQLKMKRSRSSLAKLLW